jgi:hypothetical protein
MGIDPGRPIFRAARKVVHRQSIERVDHHADDALRDAVGDTELVQEHQTPPRARPFRQVRVRRDTVDGIARLEVRDLGVDGLKDVRGLRELRVRNAGDERP